MYLKVFSSSVMEGTSQNSDKKVINFIFAGEAIAIIKQTKEQNTCGSKTLLMSKQLLQSLVFAVGH